MSHSVLVYGTMKKNQPNHHLLTDTPGNNRYLGQAMTLDRWPLVVATQYNMPFLLDVKGVGKNVRGELYEVDDKGLGVFDYYEHHPAYYTRGKIMVQLITDSNDKLLDSQTDPEEVEVYLIKNPKREILALEHLENYDPDGEVYPYFNLSLELNFNLQFMKELFTSIKYMDCSTFNE